MRGLMQQDPLILTRFLDRATKLYPNQRIATKTPTGVHRETYEELGDRVGRLASALRGIGVEPGDRVGSFAWNTWRHLEVYFAVPCMGSVLHTLNIRLHPEQVAWIANHAEDRVIVVDDSLLPAFAKVLPHLSTVERIIVMGDGDRAPLGEWAERALDHESLLAEASADFGWPDLDENEACAMCYTSGTTGHPKGVVYSHRSMVLHSYALNMPENFGLTSREVILPVVPMFHANAWGTPFGATLAGATQVYAGQFSADPASLADLVETERVTIAAGVPTVWIGVLQHLDANPRDFSSLHTLICGGSAVPVSLIDAFEKNYGVNVVQAWGMTETGPLGSMSRLLPALEDLPERERLRVRGKQGRIVAGVRFRLLDDDGQEIPWDGKSMGELQVKGNWVAATYYNDERSSDSFVDGWLRTGDVAVADEHGYLQLVDRTKDLVKSGGEWISSVELESALMGHPAVLEAAVIGVPHEKWAERPLACVVVKPGAETTKEDLIAFLAEQFPKWWLPDDVAFLEAIPKTSVGKFDKKVLREDFKTHRLPAG